MKEPFIRRPKAIAALTGLLLAVGLAVIPAQASVDNHYATSDSTGTLGKQAAPGGPVTREQIISRAKSWVDQGVPYSQESGWKDEATGGPYRRDCSGFVSMAWQLRTSLTTETLSTVAQRISVSELEPGDALVNTTSHALLFGGWTNRAKGDFFYYSEPRPGRQASRAGGNIHDYKIAGYFPSSYVPLRYKNLTTTPQTPPPAAAPVPAPKPSTTAPAPEPKPSTTAPPSPKPSTTTTPAPKPSATTTLAPKPSTTTAPKPKPSATASPTTATAAPKPGATTVPKPKPKPSVTVAVPSPDATVDVLAPEPSTSASATPPSAPVPAAADGPPSAAPPIAPDASCAPARRSTHWFWVLAFPVPIVFTS
ncbi:hypothetical protein ACIRBY_25080 [Streptomyces sp. NPDC096136]|uniref:hypothetical protein n=1 Tax=Streptomyces sp. NPDC096136 TaxID=3366076 RepID=UPI0038076884